ncbi:sensor domain-containing protein [Dokdonella soli]|uniref:EAL domain-containing protein n=1 Tax=Dokdonella soli TaxID=529810 RepID=A0ABN1IIU7_9GAMM
MQGSHDAVVSALHELAEIAANGKLSPGVRAAAERAAVVLRDRDAIVSATAARHHALVEAIPDAVVLHDVQTHILDVNAAACRLLGRTRETLLARDLGDFAPALTPEHLCRVVEEGRSGHASTIEAAIHMDDGHEIPVEVRSNLFRDNNESFIVSLLYDITARHATAGRLHEVEQRDLALLHSLDQGVTIRDGNGHIVYANPAAYRMFQVTENQLPQIERDGFPGWRFQDAHGETLASEQFPGMKALRSGAATELELICCWLPHVKSPLWMTATAVPLFHPGEDAPYQVVTTFSDVTELKRTRDLLEQTQALGNIGGYELTLENGQLVWTEEMYRLFDLSPEFPITLERALALFTPDSRELAQRTINELAAGATTRREYEIVTAIGRKRWVSAISQPIRHGDAIHSLSGMFQDITERKLLELELRHKAVTDPVTGLPNRESILDELERGIAAMSDGTGPTLLYVDLDRFKVINGVLGADVGDCLLTSAAERLRECLPNGARCGRFAGDEFLVVLPGSLREDEPHWLADAINQAFQRPFEHAGEEFVITASIGIARCPRDGETAQQLLQHAEAAMDEAKERGRNAWRAFSPAIARRIENHLVIQSQLRMALANNELRLVYQPQVELLGGRVVAAEALLRWDHPLRGELRPLAFVQHAESSGDIVAIGAWAIDQACRQLREWRDSGVHIERVAVNVSYRQLLSDSFLDSVIGALRRYDLPGASLELEMIERTLIDDTPDTMRMFKDLRDVGVVITIDDFGEGYSALNYLRRLPIDGFKISYDFMRRVPASAADAAICEAMIRVGHALGLGMVAEGVESEEQRRFLLCHGMTLGQGHLFSPALRADEFREFARARSTR